MKIAFVCPLSAGGSDTAQNHMDENTHGLHHETIWSSGPAPALGQCHLIKSLNVS
jgi:hypothetical protein